MAFLFLFIFIVEIIECHNNNHDFVDIKIKNINMYPKI